MAEILTVLARLKPRKNRNASTLIFRSYYVHYSHYLYLLLIRDSATEERLVELHTLYCRWTLYCRPDLWVCTFWLLQM